MKSIVKIETQPRAFTLIELLIVIAIIALLAALIFPVFERSREQGRSTVCLSNIRQTGTSIQLYVQDHDETYPMNRFPDEAHPEGKCVLTGNAPYPISTSEDNKINWRRVVQPYIKSKQVMTCPSNPYLNNSIYP